MGLLDRAVEAVSGKGSETDSSFEDEFDEENIEEDVSDDDGIDTEEESHEWETAYQFADDAIEEVGFSSLNEFIDKAMVRRIDMSPMYRDRIESGVRTMDMISDSMGNIHDLRGEYSGNEGSYKEYVEEVKAANDLIDQLDRMDGKEEEMANAIIGIAKDAVDGLKDRKMIQSNVDSTMGVSREE